LIHDIATAIASRYAVVMSLGVAGDVILKHAGTRPRLHRMNDLETRLVALDLLIARTKPLKERQEADLKRIKSYKGDNGAAKELLAKTKKSLKAAKTERKAIIVKLLKAQDAAAKKMGGAAGR
jgi:hypothetical protein